MAVLKLSEVLTTDQIRQKYRYIAILFSQDPKKYIFKKQALCDDLRYSNLKELADEEEILHNRFMMDISVGRNYLEYETIEKLSTETFPIIHEKIERLASQDDIDMVVINTTTVENSEELFEKNAHIVISSEEEHVAALARIDILMNAEEGTLEADELATLASAVQLYEKYKFPLG